MREPGQDFYAITEDILENPDFLRLRNFPHHGKRNSLYVHSLDTAKCAYAMACKFHMSREHVRSVTRAALLHDFFGYDWHKEARRRARHYAGWHRVTHLHALTHGALAARYADRVFGLTSRERSAITTHMFPLAPLPRNAEAWVLTLADKVVATRELSAAAGHYMAELCRRS